VEVPALAGLVRHDRTAAGGARVERRAPDERGGVPAPAIALLEVGPRPERLHGVVAGEAPARRYGRHGVRVLPDAIGVVPLPTRVHVGVDDAAAVEAAEG